MRSAILQAIDFAHHVRGANQGWESSQASSVQIPPGDYASMLSDKQKGNLERVYKAIDSLMNCIKMEQIVSVKPAKTNSLEIYMRQSSDYIVVELSIYGPLASIFKYGFVSDDVIRKIEECLSTVGVIPIT